MKKPGRHKILLQILLLIALLNIVGQLFYKRFDLTEDNRYTLSPAATQLLEEANSPLFVEVFLEGKLPSEFRRLRNEVKQLLEEFEARNPNLTFRFIDPNDPDIDATNLQQRFDRFGIRPAQVQTTLSGKVSSELVYPWALASYGGSTVRIQLLKNLLGATQEERVNSSVQNLEYAFADGFGKLLRPKRRKVAVLKGNGELDDRYIADFFGSLREYYYIAPFTLDSVARQPEKTLDALSEYDLLVAAGPTEPFSDAEKYVLDQFVMRGGASLWLVDASQNKQDSLSGNTFAVMRDLNLNDYFFKYGLRVNPNLVKDVYSAPIVLASGSERESQYDRYPWFYYPLSGSGLNHPIVKNIEAVKFQYASGIDTLPNTVKKTILLSSSPLSQTQALPAEINMDKEIPKYLEIVNRGPEPGTYNKGEIPLAVLLEGRFPSAYANRVKPFKLGQKRDTSAYNRMILISDAQVIANQLDRGRPIELGFDKWTQTYYGNKEFLLNCVNYLLDDSGLINIRSKDIRLAFLDPQKVAASRNGWQAVNLLLPLGLLLIFGLIYKLLRHRTYSS